MSFSDFLKATVQLTMGCAAVLIMIAVVDANRLDDRLALMIAAGWWLLSTLIGLYLGRRVSENSALRSLLRDAPESSTLPQPQPGRILWNRLWPLIFFVFVCGGLAWLYPQVAAVGGGFAIIWSLGWRKHALAVKAIEDRDGAQFYIEKGSPFKSIKVVRIPGWKRN